MHTTDVYSTDRHTAGPHSILAQAIHEAREEQRTGRTSLLNLRMSLMNLAIWRRGHPMHSWTYAQAFQHAAYGARRLPA